MTCVTLLLHPPRNSKYEKEVAAILEIPFENITQVALIPVAHTIGTKFKAAARKPLKEVLHLESW